LPCNLPYQFSHTFSRDAWQSHTFVRMHLKLGKDSISHESIASQKTKTGDPSSVLHFSISGPRFNSRGEPSIVTARRRRCKCRNPSPSRPRRLAHVQHQQHPATATCMRSKFSEGS